MIRALLGVFGGLALAMTMVFVLEGIGHQMYPPPADLDPTDREAFAAAVAAMPVMALVMVLIAYSLGTFAGAWLAARVGGRPFYAFLVGGVMTLAGMTNLIAVPHPLWFTIVGTLIFLPSAWVASRLAVYD
ncbi:MAG TPA: hypothetical protein QGF95_06375 [Candidatus Latescibacteria bacterium]|jgi:hypothetical protein|nr:hypothetical protein [Gemmatimonadaceae bacterium]MDP6014592.1 hypothetical protein [Candidatus Latescibacterota bacterium]HJP30162.1 hypothetical protein [Candidatus Latescibacterota bacterium]|tara:strand:- start:570 stop:962 length:393 start_codon:yes stop_codon:yes gene_type:complete